MIKKIMNRLRYEKMKVVERREDEQVRKLIQNGQSPIYHVHIRKTAGTTINCAFLSNANPSNIWEFYVSIARKPNHRQIRNSKVFVGWNIQLIDEGNFSYAFSHIPIYQLNLRPETFVFTCMRDPVKRVVSHYNMLRYYKINNIDHPCMEIEGEWLGNSFDDFISRCPKEHMLNQLYMFSKDFNIDQAAVRLLSLNKVIYTENLTKGLADLESMTGWELPISNQNKYDYKEELSDTQINNLREYLDPEYELLALIDVK